MIERFVGNTPVMRLTHATTPEMAEVWVKLEGLNPAAASKTAPR